MSDSNSCYFSILFFIIHLDILYNILPTSFSMKSSFLLDSTAFNQIVVNETIDFIDDHVKNYSRKPFFAYAALGAVHIPHSPPDTYLDGTKIKGVYPTRHMDMLLEMDKSVGSLMDAIDERDLTSNTIVIFTSDNGGVPPKDGSEDFNHYSSGKLRGNKGMLYL